MESFRWREDAPTDLVLLAVAKCLIWLDMDRANWSELAILAGVRDQVLGHHRLLRSLDWHDPDYDGNVHQVVPAILGDVTVDPWYSEPITVSSRFKNLAVVSEYLDLPSWLSQHEPALAAKLLESSTADALLPDGTVLTAAEAAAAKLDVAEMRRQIDRIRRDHGTDPEALIGHVKELVESTCKTILGMTGDENGKESVPALVTRALKHLGLHPDEVQAAGGDAAEARALKLLFGGMNSVLSGAAELRNKRGAGHGRSGAPLVDDAVSRLTAGMVLAGVVFLCEMYEQRLVAPFGQAGTEGPRLTDAQVGVGSVVNHPTFGRGVIAATYATGQKFQVDVDFAVSGRKRLLMRYAPMILVRR